MKKLVLFFLLLFIAVPHVYAAPASLSFDPVNLNVKKGQTFEVRINMFTGDESIASTDIMVNYDKILLEPLPDKTTNGDIFNSVDSKVIVPGKFYVYGIETNRAQTQPAQGTVATISFKALQTGNVKLAFDCNPNIKNTSQIIKSNTDFENIINCTATGTHTADITIEEGSVLGLYTDAYAGINSYTAVFGVLVAVFTYFIIIRFRKAQQEIT